MSWTPAWAPGDDEDQMLVGSAMETLRQVGLQMPPENRALSSTWLKLQIHNDIVAAKIGEVEDDPTREALLKTAFINLLVHLGGFLALKESDIVDALRAAAHKEGARRRDAPAVVG